MTYGALVVVHGSSRNSSFQQLDTLYAMSVLLKYPTL